MTDLQLSVFLDQIADNLLLTYYDAKRRIIDNPGVNPGEALYGFQLLSDQLHEHAKALKGVS